LSLNVRIFGSPLSLLLQQFCCIEEAEKKDILSTHKESSSSFSFIVYSHEDYIHFHRIEFVDEKEKYFPRNQGASEWLVLSKINFDGSFFYVVNKKS
jgi:hypothetical protein